MTIIWKPYAGDEDYPGLRRPVVMLEGGNKVLSRDWSEDKDVTLKRLTLSLDYLLEQGWEATWRTSEREFALVQWLVYLVQVGGIGFGYDFFLLKETAGPMCHRLTRDLCPLTDEDFRHTPQRVLGGAARPGVWEHAQPPARHGRSFARCRLGGATEHRTPHDPRLRLRPRDRQLPARTARRQVGNDLAGDDAGRG